MCLLIDVHNVYTVWYIKGMFCVFYSGEAAVPAAVSSLLNAMQSLEVAVCQNHSDCCASVLTHNFFLQVFWQGLPNNNFWVLIHINRVVTLFSLQTISIGNLRSQSNSCVHNSERVLVTSRTIFFRSWLHELSYQLMLGVMIIIIAKFIHGIVSSTWVVACLFLLLKDCFFVIVTPLLHSSRHGCHVNIFYKVIFKGSYKIH